MHRFFLNLQRIELDVKLQSPYLIIPEKGIFSNDANLVVMDLGKLTLFGSTTDPKSAPRVSIYPLFHVGDATKAIWYFSEPPRTGYYVSVL